MTLWFSAPRIECHFCGSSTDLRKGKHTARSFRCATCDSLNFLKADGSIDEDTQQIYSNPNLPANQESFAKRAHPTTLTQQTGFRFCAACERNIALQTYLLASYYGDAGVDLQPEEEARLEAMLPDYKLELEDRYPTCCEDCGPAAARILRERDNKSRAVALNNTILRNSSPIKSHRIVRDPRASTSWKLEGLVWKIKGSIWVLLQLASVAMYTLGQSGRNACFWNSKISTVGVFHPNLAIRLLQQYQLRYIALSCLASFLVSFWNPLWNRLRQHRMQAPEPARLKLRNFGFWNTMLFTAFLMRCIFCVCLRRPTFASHTRTVSLIALIHPLIVSFLFHAGRVVMTSFIVYTTSIPFPTYPAPYYNPTSQKHSKTL